MNLKRRKQQCVDNFHLFRFHFSNSLKHDHTNQAKNDKIRSVTVDENKITSTEW